MNTESKAMLSRLHALVTGVLTRKKKHKAESVLVSLLNLKSNECYRILNEASLPLAAFSKYGLDELLASKLVRYTDEPGRIALTALGAWEIESEKGAISWQRLVGVVDSKCFDLFGSSSPLTEKERVILLAMIAARSFSEESSIDLKKGDNVLNKMSDLLKASFMLLRSHGIVRKLKEEELFGAKGNEHPVSHLVRHTDAMPKKTMGIYHALGQQKYFLDVSKGNDISEDSLTLLIGLIYGDSMSVGVKAELERFCQDMPYVYSTFIFDLRTHRYADPVYDECITNAIEQYYASRYKWEEK